MTSNNAKVYFFYFTLEKKDCEQTAVLNMRPTTDLKDQTKYFF